MVPHIGQEFLAKTEAIVWALMTLLNGKPSICRNASIAFSKLKFRFGPGLVIERIKETFLGCATHSKEGTFKHSQGMAIT